MIILFIVNDMPLKEGMMFTLNQDKLREKVSSAKTKWECYSNDTTQVCKTDIGLIIHSKGDDDERHIYDIYELFLIDKDILIECNETYIIKSIGNMTITLKSQNYYKPNTEFWITLDEFEKIPFDYRGEI